MLAHSHMGPSSLHVRELCPGSRRIVEAIPGRKEDEDSKDAKAGQKGHDTLEALIKGEMDRETAQTLHGAQWNAVAFCFDNATTLLNDAEWKDAQVFTEHRVDLRGIHPVIDFGTLDLAAVIPFQKALVIDYKLGYQEVPAAHKNVQMMAYALGIMDEFDVDEVHVWILAGGRGFVSDCRFDRSDLERGREHLRRIVANTEVPFARLCPSEEACRYCSGAVTCPALVELAGQIPADRDPVDLSPREVSIMLDYYERLQAWFKKVRARGYALCSQEIEVPGWALAPGRSPGRAWKETVTPDEIKKIGKKFKKKVGDVMPPTLVSPAELEKKWGKKKDLREALAPLIYKRPGKLDLRRTKEVADAE